MPYANNKSADQPAHPCSLISIFVVHCLDSIMPLVSISEISRLWLLAVAEQTGLSHTWSKMFEDTFSLDTVQLCFILTQRAYIGNGEKSCFILQQFHWAETRDVI